MMHKGETKQMAIERLEAEVERLNGIIAKQRSLELQIEDCRELIEAARDMVKHQKDRHELGHCCRGYTPTETYKLGVALEKIDNPRCVVTEKRIDHAPIHPDRCRCAGSEHCKWCGQEPCVCEHLRK